MHQTASTATVRAVGVPDLDHVAKYYGSSFITDLLDTCNLSWRYGGSSLLFGQDFQMRTLDEVARPAPEGMVRSSSSGYHCAAVDTELGRTKTDPGARSCVLRESKRLLYDVRSLGSVAEINSKVALQGSAFCTRLLSRAAISKKPARGCSSL